LRRVFWLESLGLQATPIFCIKEIP